MPDSFFPSFLPLASILGFYKTRLEEEEEWGEKEDFPTLKSYRAQLKAKIVQMMFVSGETAEPSPETTTLIEEIVRQQVIEMVCVCQ